MGKKDQATRQSFYKMVHVMVKSESTLYCIEGATWILKSVISSGLPQLSCLENQPLLVIRRSGRERSYPGYSVRKGKGLNQNQTHPKTSDLHQNFISDSMSITNQKKTPDLNMSTLQGSLETEPEVNFLA
ncbi:hypothetical protein UY3_18536 [Chelonia mydas]|uniref:Uncharacterized protein n=1 Tax=Chelonia mydas TaxID=8469 RepID=M7AH82_CHEMY|nr:hypothetical protein UY3_18536 [Chelonia mydas]